MHFPAHTIVSLDLLHHSFIVPFALPCTHNRSFRSIAPQFHCTFCITLHTQSFLWIYCTAVSLYLLHYPAHTIVPLNLLHRSFIVPFALPCTYNLSFGFIAPQFHCTFCITLHTQSFLWIYCTTVSLYLLHYPAHTIVPLDLLHHSFIVPFALPCTHNRSFRSIAPQFHCTFCITLHTQSFLWIYCTAVSLYLLHYPAHTIVPLDLLHHSFIVTFALPCTHNRSFGSIAPQFHCTFCITLHTQSFLWIYCTTVSLYLLHYPAHTIVPLDLLHHSFIVTFALPCTHNRFFGSIAQQFYCTFCITLHTQSFLWIYCTTVSL